MPRALHAVSNTSGSINMLQVVTFGNMDSAAATDDGAGAVSLVNGRVACDEIIEVAGYRILGSPWTPKVWGLSVNA